MFDYRALYEIQLQVSVDFLRVVKLNDFGNRWCKPEYVEPNALKEWKVSIFKTVDQRIKFYSQNTNLLPPKQGILDFHRKYAFVPADKAANVVVQLY